MITNYPENMSRHDSTTDHPRRRCVIAATCGGAVMLGLAIALHHWLSQ